MYIVKLNESEMETFLAWIASVGASDAYELRVGFDVDGVKLKVNNGVWSPGIGQVTDH